ncbi:MAG: DNA-3-methyladenine glycosylase I [bacterium]
MQDPKKTKRCPWGPSDDPLYCRYHDTEWGVPVHEDKKICEFLVLEAFQAGLSWRTVLYKRQAFRKAFASFSPRIVARFTQSDIARLMTNAAIIRNKQKIVATVGNAQRFLDIQKEFGTFERYMWQWVGGEPINHRLRTLSDYRPTSREAERWSKDLSRRGFRFLGPTVVYAHMQAVGMVNDHIVSCFRYREVQSRKRHRGY